MDDNLVPVIATIVIVGLPIAAWMTSRILAHRERMAMLQRGYVPGPRRSHWGRWGGYYQQAGWTPPLEPQPATPPAADQQHWNRWCDNETAHDSLRRGIRLAMVGIALLIGLSFIGYRGHAGPFGGPIIEPGPWLLGGLIPTFVGFAQILVALLSGARLGPPPPFRDVAPPPPAAGSPFTPPPTARPVNPAEELPSPLRPPERF